LYIVLTLADSSAHSFLVLTAPYLSAIVSTSRASIDKLHILASTAINNSASLSGGFFNRGTPSPP
jgi:hypothetical protein